MGGRNTPFRGRKSQLYEGGIHVDALISWSGYLKPGKFQAVVHAIDWLPTLGGLAGFRPRPDLNLDGIDVWKQLTGEASRQERVLYWEGVGHRSSALRKGDWNLVIQRGQPRNTELFNLVEDPVEQHDLAARMPERVDELNRLLKEQAGADGDSAVPRETD